MSTSIHEEFNLTLLTTSHIFLLPLNFSKETGDYSYLQTVPHDPRFPNINQTKNCLQNFIDFHRCNNMYGEDYKPCNYFKFAYKELCPGFLVEKWSDEVDEGTFPYKLD
ncbi:unnamed protein product [Schistocephalus solidus]|uniref:Cytochrome c oxidase subunit 6B1 n=1 Tax=Schistocephalus solidus TaxID=70667 RepID=A0A183TKG4_SCHSO|nr:unnamed protein product [Schistocephalus solidus]